MPKRGKREAHLRSKKKKCVVKDESPLRQTPRLKESQKESQKQAQKELDYAEEDDEDDKLLNVDEDEDNDNEVPDEQINLNEHLKETKPQLFQHPETVQRLAIAFMFMKKKWKGHGAIIPQIKNALGLSHGTNVAKVLEDVIECSDSNKQYTGKKEYSVQHGRPPKIEPDGVYVQIIADCLEDGKSLALTLDAVNMHCKERGEPPFTMNPIRTVVKKLKPKVFKVKKRNQGSNDPNSKWCHARVNQNTQFLIRAGKLESQKRGNATPDYFN